MRLTNGITAAALTTALVAVPATGALAVGSVPPPSVSVKVSGTHLTPGKSIKVVFSNFAPGAKITLTKTVRQKDGTLKTTTLKTFLADATGSLTTYLGAGTPANYGRLFSGLDQSGKVASKNVTFVVFKKTP